MTWSRRGRAASSRSTDGSVPALSRTAAGRVVSRRPRTASESTACWAAVRLHLVAGPLEHQGALREHQLGVDVGPHLDRGVVLPGAVGVRPALDPVGPPAGAGCADPRRPGVEARVGARHRLHVLGAVRVGEHHRGVDGVVALAEHGGRHLERLVDDRLGGSGAAVDARSDVRGRGCGRSDAGGHGCEGQRSHVARYRPRAARDTPHGGRRVSVRKIMTELVKVRDESV